MICFFLAAESHSKTIINMKTPHIIPKSINIKKHKRWKIFLKQSEDNESDV